VEVPASGIGELPSESRMWIHRMLRCMLHDLQVFCDLVAERLEYLITIAR